ncbi:Holliday junction branch migration protein RuvA [Roseovarius aestuariivivens]|uniref:Holliday junction branch migration protein RuvA n=1 Tax=Roseovarius aestuariivivens TaxID=1888910 RepID=UPI00108093EB|nr:Holliday junction branch migration protein RuvA [Roseovarius aestuariivivens]
MIGRIAGRLDYRGADHVLIDVRGVGYLVYCSDRTLASLPGPGEAVALYTDLLVREDLLQLYGFPTLAEKEWHRLLMSVQGVGAKASLAILGTLGPEGVGRAIALGDVTAVKAAKGIGPKTAQRVVNELKDKAPEVMAMGAAAATTPAPVGDDAVIEPAVAAPAPPPAPSGAAQAEALSALTNLGYGPGEAAGAVAQAAGAQAEADTATLIRAALKLLAPKG